MRRAQSFVPGWPFFLLAVGIIGGAGPALVEAMQWKPPPMVANDIGTMTAVCRGEIYEGDRRIATLEDAKALRKITCLRGSLTIGGEHCGRDGTNNSVPVVLTTLKALRNLEVVTGKLRFQDLSGLSSIDELEHLTGVGSLEACSTGGLTSVLLPALQALGSINVTRSGLQTIVAPKIARFEHLAVDGAGLQALEFSPGLEVKRVTIEMTSFREEVAINDTPWLDTIERIQTLSTSTRSLKGINAPMLKSLNSLELSSGSIETVTMPELKTIERITIRGATKLRAVRLTALQGSAKDITIEDADLSDLQLGELEAVDRLSIRRTNLKALSLPKLEQAVALQIEENPHLRTLDLPKVKSAEGSVARNPVLGVATRKQLPSTLEVCENEGQPPCKWRTSLMRSISKPTTPLMVGGVKLRLSGTIPPPEKVLTDLKKIRGFRRGATYAMVRLPFSWLAVELDAKDRPRAMAIISEHPTGGASPSLFPMRAAYVDFVVFDGFPDTSVVARVDTGVSGPFVVDVFLNARIGFTMLGRINVTDTALDQRVFLHGLRGVMVGRGTPIDVGFAPEPPDVSYPNLPLVFRMAGGAFAPDMAMQNAKVKAAAP